LILTYLNNLLLKQRNPRLLSLFHAMEGHSAIDMSLLGSPA
jgi:hypothetical protein